MKEAKLLRNQINTNTDNLCTDKDLHDYYRQVAASDDDEDDADLDDEDFDDEDEFEDEEERLIDALIDNSNRCPKCRSDSFYAVNNWEPVNENSLSLVHECRDCNYKAKVIFEAVEVCKLNA